MALVAGTVAINQSTGAATGAGLARVFYDALISEFAVSPAQVPQSVPGAQNQMARMANVFATAIDYLVANGVITIAPGIAVSTTGSAAAQTGATTASGTGSIA
jgi:hypothetical protein